MRCLRPGGITAVRCVPGRSETFHYLFSDLAVLELLCGCTQMDVSTVSLHPNYDAAMAAGPVG